MTESHDGGYLSFVCRQGDGYGGCLPAAVVIAVRPALSGFKQQPVGSKDFQEPPALGFG